MSALIAISCRNVRENPTYPELTGVRVPYLESIIAAGGTPLMIPIAGPIELTRRLFEMADGVLVPGGEDVEPRNYGEDPHPKLGGIAPARDAIELELARWAIEEGKPFLGICRGVQIMNVAMGGNLYQDIDDQRPGKAPHGMSQWDEIKHPLILEKDSRLATILGVSEIGVNSLHHQAVREPGTGMRPVGRTPDGLIEALEGEGRGFAIGIQCHPETLWQNEEPRWLRLFEAFVAASAARS